MIVFQVIGVVTTALVVCGVIGWATGFMSFGIDVNIEK